MDYADLKDELSSIAELAASVPEPFRERCFELLLEHLLASLTPADKTGEASSQRDSTKARTPEDDSGADASIPTPSQIKVFMQKTGITATDLRTVLLVEDGEVHFIREPTTNKVARGQIEWALLLALSSGITSNAMVADPEAVRSICQEKGFYDAKNFSGNFRKPANAALFQGPLEAQGEAQRLTAEGQKELATIVKRLASGE